MRRLTSKSYQKKIARRLRKHKNTGYIYFIDRRHPLASSLVTGVVYYHRHVLSVKLGRWLESWELVHHKDEDRTNNDPTNLELKTRSKHASDHQIERYGRKKYRRCGYCNDRFWPDKRFGNRRSKFCSQRCAHEASVKATISKRRLRRLISRGKTYESIGRRYGITGAAVKKKAVKFGIADLRWK